MRIPYVIDNQNYKLSDILNAILADHSGQSMDVATAYFNIQGYKLLKGKKHIGVSSRHKARAPIHTS
ncbi:MAG: hypothetical protein A2Z50_07855 [Nitrospirae bacterium RBG_19FT_COMBO_42_15]|nr:MAG: hypothetical protein A2Z50_07855 [Nitrospirae bacterium RBG_19FT_COMBO_42_15]